MPKLPRYCSILNCWNLQIKFAKWGYSNNFPKQSAPTSLIASKLLNTGNHMEKHFKSTKHPSVLQPGWTSTHTSTFTSRVWPVCEGSSRLGVLLGVLPLSLFDCSFLTTWGFKHLICSCSFSAICPLWGFFICQNLGSSILYFLFLSFVGCFVLLMNGKAFIIF